MDPEQDKRQHYTLLVLGGLGLTLLIVVAWLFNTSSMDLAVFEFQLSWMVRTVGAYLAVVSAVLVCVALVRQFELLKILPFVLPLLAGLALYQAQSMAALGLAVVAAAYILAPRIGARQNPPEA